MGCDINSHAERRDSTGGFELIDGLDPFNWQSYAMFAFLAGVRNSSSITPIAQRRGLPPDASVEVAAVFEFWEANAHSTSWLSLEELMEFNYEAPCVGDTTYRAFLGAEFFAELERLRAAGADRVVFWFDS